MSDKLYGSIAVSNKVSRNGFDLSCRNNFTAKCGELLPIFHRDLTFGDSIRLSVNHFTRTAPVDTAAATQIREYIDVFWVPYRITWKNAPQVHTQNRENPVVAKSPFTNLEVGSSTPNFDYWAFIGKKSAQETPVGGGLLGQMMGMKNAFGYSRGAMSAKLMNHLGYNYISIANLRYFALESADYQDQFHYTGPRDLSLYPLLAYQAIYYNFYRNTQWEDNQPYNYNVDYLGSDAHVNFYPSTNPTWTQYWNNPTIFDLHYTNYPRDLFFGLLPDSQEGEPAEVTSDFNVEIPSFLAENGTVKVNGADLGALPTNNLIPEQNMPVSFIHTAGNAPTGTLRPSVRIPKLDVPAESAFTILQFRKAQFLQKYREIRGSGQQDYKNLVQRLFNVTVPNDLTNQPLYLGGGSSTIKISEVENTNLVGENPADIKGKGIGSGDTETISFTAKEPGLIMVLYHAQPVIDYSLNALHFDVVRTEADDFLNPIFDRLGYQELPSYYLDTTVGNSYLSPSEDGTELGFGFTPIGYTTRYFDYKTGIDMTLGDFRETQRSWLAPLNFDYLKKFIVKGNLSINSNFFKVDPSILDPIFAVKAGFYDVDGVNVAWKPTLPQNTVATDQLRVFATINCNAIRPLDRNGLPY